MRGVVARAGCRSRAQARRSLLSRLRPSSNEEEFSPEGEVVLRRVHVPSEVVREQWPEWRSSVRYSRACVVVVGESRWDHDPITPCLTAASRGVGIHIKCSCLHGSRDLWLGLGSGLSSCPRWAWARRKPPFHEEGTSGETRISPSAAFA